MKGIVIALIFCAVAFVLQIPNMFSAYFKFGAIGIEFRLNENLINSLIYFITGIITYQIHKNIGQNNSLVKSTLIKVITFAVIMVFLNELGLVIIYNLTGNPSEYYNPDNGSFVEHLIGNLSWGLKTGIVFCLIWILYNHKDIKQNDSIIDNLE